MKPYRNFKIRIPSTINAIFTAFYSWYFPIKAKMHSTCQLKTKSDISNQTVTNDWVSTTQSITNRPISYGQ